MPQQAMYPAIDNSPETSLATLADALATEIAVADASVLPEGPNLATLGIDEDAELIRYAARAGNVLVGCERGLGAIAARSWPEGTPVYRAYSALDHQRFIDNIADLAAAKLDADGDASAATVAFTQASARANLATGATLATQLGRIKKYFADLGVAAFAGIGTGAGDAAAGSHAAQHAATGADPLAPAAIGAAAAAHTHAAADIVSGAIATSRLPTIPLAKGGTGATTAAAGLAALGGVPQARTVAGKALTADVTLAAADIGAAEASHVHAAANITSGTLSSSRLPTVPLTKGGTGATTADAARVNLGAAALAHEHAASDIAGGTLDAARLPTVPLSKGGTGAATAAEARETLGAAAAGHAHTASDITGGTVDSARLPTIPLSKGGTGATTAAAGLTALGGVPQTRTVNGKALSANVTLAAADVGAAAAGHAHAASEISGAANLGPGKTVIPSGADLDDYNTPGAYCCTSNANATGVANRPANMNYGFMLEVVSPINWASSNLVQVITTYFGHRYWRMNATGAWSDWTRDVAAGSFDIAVAPGTWAQQTVTFSPQFRGASPAVVATLRGSHMAAGDAVAVVSKGLASAEIAAYNGGAATATLGVDWLATMI